MKGRSQFWDDLAAEVMAAFPLAASDWVQHSDAVDGGLYSVQNRRKKDPPAAPGLHIFADEPPLSPEEEEAYAAVAAGPAQMELF